MINERAIKAKDAPWDADLTGSVVRTVTTNVYVIFGFRIQKSKILFTNAFIGWSFILRYFTQTSPEAGPS